MAHTIARSTKSGGQGLARNLRKLAESPPSSWAETGVNARQGLHGLLRYPAMMVPRMQGDIIDVLLASTGPACHVLDPFVGSGTTMTEAVARGLDFTGVDINPLAALVCEAKAAVDAGVDVEHAAAGVLTALRLDFESAIDIDFPGRVKWFSDTSAVHFSRLRRAILALDDRGARKLMWTVFAETVRQCSNSRTSTYKLHIRAPDNMIEGTKVTSIFEGILRQTLSRVNDFRNSVKNTRTRAPSVKILCQDIRRAKLRRRPGRHEILVTSPPYGDNQTTIPYGQFSYLALQWIPTDDLPTGISTNLLSSTHSLDTASLGGSKVDSRVKEQTMRLVSPQFDEYIDSARLEERMDAADKVSSFMYDFFEALAHIRSGSGSAHWVLTTGNRTAGGITVPFDSICRDIVEFLGGKCIASLQRELPNKRMPSRNSIGAMITRETTLIAEFA